MIDEIYELLRKREVCLKEIAEIVYILQSPYSPNITEEECLRAVEGVLKKREVQYTILTGVTLDILAEEKKLPTPLQEILECDEPLYGIDEVLAFGITNIYGSIGITSFGFLDKQKIGVIGKLNENKRNHVNTFLDDIVAGIAAAASAKIAHQERKEDQNKPILKPKTE